MRKHPLSLCLLLLLTLQGSAEKQIDYFEGYETQFYQTKPSTTQTNPSTDAQVQTPSQGQTPNPAPSPIPFEYAENDPLHFGNPTDALADPSSPNNYLMIKPQFSLSYNKDTFTANWVAWHLCKNDIGDADRSNKFIADKELPQDWYALKKADYKFTAYGFDRGHLCPSADRTSSAQDNQQTFLMTNMIPQAPDCNRNTWKKLEEYERALAQKGNELYIFAGGLGKGGTGNSGYFEGILIDQGEILVPQYCWKIILVLPEGDDDFNRVTQDSQVIAVCIPNKQGCQEAGSWNAYTCTIDYLEEQLSMDFFELLPDEIEAALED